MIIEVPAGHVTFKSGRESNFVPQIVLKFETRLVADQFKVILVLLVFFNFHIYPGILETRWKHLPTR
jgi:hypothetical protein